MTEITDFQGNSDSRSEQHEPKCPKLLLCWACRAQLEEQQLLCRECGKWQNWKRYVNSTSATITIVTIVGGALISSMAWIIDFMASEPPPRISVSSAFADDFRSLTIEIVNLEQYHFVLSPNAVCRGRFVIRQDGSDYTREDVYVADDLEAVLAGEINKVRYYSKFDVPIEEVDPDRDFQRLSCWFVIDTGSRWGLSIITQAGAGGLHDGQTTRLVAESDDDFSLSLPHSFNFRSGWE